MNEWREDIRQLMRKAGVDGVNMVFLFGDHQIKEEAFLEDVNMILNSGDIPNLYENEERLEIIEKVREVHYLITSLNSGHLSNNKVYLITHQFYSESTQNPNLYQ